MENRDFRVWEKVKNEIPRCQFDAVIHMREKFRKLGWAYEKAEPGFGKSIILIALAPNGNRHWINVSPNGDVVPMPVEMGCKS